MIKIYADFNSIDERERLILSILGSREDLKKHSNVIQDGLSVIFYMADEFEVEGTLLFDLDWYGRPDFDTILYYDRKDLSYLPWPAIVVAENGEAHAEWQLVFERPLGSVAFNQLAKYLKYKLIDEQLRNCEVVRNASGLKLVLSWTSSDVENLYPLSIAADWAEDCGNPVQTVQGRPRNEWPIGYPR